MGFVNSKLYFYLKGSPLYRFIQPIWRWAYVKKTNMAMRNAKEALLELKKLFDKHSIPFWLDFGTLLGAYRDHKFISYDGDIDVAIEGANSKAVFNFLKGTTFKLIGVCTLGNDQITQIKVFYKGVHIDIVSYFDDKNISFAYEQKFIKGFTELKDDCYNVGLIRIEVPKVALKEFEFLNEQFSIPLETDEYLKAHYGPNYMIPDSSFDFEKDAPNITLCPVDDIFGIYRLIK